MTLFDPDDHIGTSTADLAERDRRVLAGRIAMRKIMDLYGIEPRNVYLAADAVDSAGTDERQGDAA